MMTFERCHAIYIIFKLTPYKTPVTSTDFPISTAPMYSLLIFLSSAFVLLTARLAYERFRRRFIDKLPGPPPTTWLTGNMPDLFRSQEISDAPFAWTKEYGTVLRIHNEFSRKTLFMSDPKAIQYILNTSGYNFPKTSSGRANSNLILGKGLVWADGSQHARQRKIMTPAFSFNSLRDFIPMFRHKAQKTVNQIRKQIESANTSDPIVVNMVPWLSRTTLDIIGAAAADYDFEAIEGGQNNKLARTYSNLLADAFYQRGDIDMAVAYLMSKVPDFMFSLLKRLPTRSLNRLRPYMSVVTDVAREVIDKQTALYVSGKEGSKDIMSVLVHANLSENPKAKLTDEEVIAQLTTIFFAGHETTASSLVWALYELSRHPAYQNKVREEIRATRAHVAERGDGEITMADLDSMPHLQALMKETLRYHPITAGVFRQAGRDDHIPLDIPVKLTTGEVITSLPIEKGTQVFLSFIAYNRLKSVWGEDADVWRPERFLEENGAKHQTSLGVISNVATFSSGIRSCIGWRFSVLEMQAILVELVENFEFSPPPGDVEILRVAAGVMGPMVKGSKSGRTELPLTVTPLQA